MKKLVIYLLIAYIGLSFSMFFQSCKRGPDDPSLTLRTRKARMVGDWVSTEYKINGVKRLGNRTDSTTGTIICNPGTPEEFENTWSTVIDTTVRVRYKFDKDGSFQFDSTGLIDKRFNFDVDTSNNCVANNLFGDTMDIEVNLFAETSNVIGDWNFGGGVGTLNAKEQLVLTDFEGDFTQIWRIRKLRNKQIVLEREFVLTNGAEPVIIETTLVPKE